MDYRSRKHELGTLKDESKLKDTPHSIIKKILTSRPIMREKGEEYILLSIPMEIEFKALLDQLDVDYRKRVIEGVPGITFQSKSGNVFAFISKIGRTNTAFDLGIISRRLNIKKIINIGTAGSLDSEVNSLDVVVATKVAYYDVDLTSFGYQYGQMSGCPSSFKTDPTLAMKLADLELPFKIHKGLVLTADSFLTKENIKKEIIEQFDHPLAIDMEGAAVGQVAERLGIPFVVIRSISDVVSQEGNTAVHENLAEISARNGAKIALHLLK